MKPVKAYPADLFAKRKSHMLVFAHQDDELPYAGLIHRMGPDVQLLWITNGDGTAKDVDETPAFHAQRREDETRAAMRLLGIPDAQLTFLRYSELDLYAAYGELAQHPDVTPEIFGRACEEVVAHVGAVDPDVLWTLAYQGGHIEHDMAHLCAVKAVRALNASREVATPLYELPAYELIFAVPLRFKPWRKAAVHEIWLTPEELATKHAMFEVYPSQGPLLATFKKLIFLYGKLSALRLRHFTFDDYARREEFALVPEDRDHTSSSHCWGPLDYMFENYEGVRLSFEGTTARLAEQLLS